MTDPTLLRSILTRTRDLVAQGWCQGAYARGNDGEGISLRDPLACQWCLAGALDRSLYEHQQQVLYNLVRLRLKRFLPGRLSLGTYNDLPTTTQADVLAVLDRAIAGVKP